MANLPDLDTSNISFIAYWNAIDQGGVNSISPEEVTSYNRVQEYTIYDNGIEGTSLIPPQEENIFDGQGREGTFRAKNDGWIIAYIDRREELTQSDSADDVQGPWDMVWNWASDVGPGPQDPDVANGNLTRLIENLAGELSNFGSINYSPTDVPLYNYEYSNASTLTGLNAYNDGGGIFGFSYTSETNRLWHTVAANGRGLGGNLTAPSGSDICNGDYGAYDMILNSEAPNSGTEYTLQEVEGNRSIHTNLILWN